MWEGQSVKRPLKWKLKKLLAAVCYLLLLLALTVSLFVVYIFKIYKFW